jgi:transketolase
MLAISELKVHFVGSHAGVEIGADGPSQMALEDLAIMRAIIGSTVLYPSDAVSAAKLTKLMPEAPGIAYMRTTRGAYPVLYSADTDIYIGGAGLLRGGEADEITLIGAGVTTHECLAAADQLATDGITARVIDCYSVKPINAGMLISAAAATSGRIIVVEDHYAEGGIGEAVLTALAEADVAVHFTHLCVRELAASGTPTELLDAAGISSPHIVRAAKYLVENKG